MDGLKSDTPINNGAYPFRLGPALANGRQSPDNCIRTIYKFHLPNVTSRLASIVADKAMVARGAPAPETKSRESIPFYSSILLWHRYPSFCKANQQRPPVIANANNAHVTQRPRLQFTPLPYFFAASLQLAIITPTFVIMFTPHKDAQRGVNNSANLVA